MKMRTRLLTVAITFFVATVVLISKILYSSAQLTAALDVYPNVEVNEVMDGPEVVITVEQKISDKVLQLAETEALKADIFANVKQEANKELLSKAFAKCDTDSSNYLSLKEVEVCAAEQVQVHLIQALRANFFIFTAIDENPRNGAISWDEYITHYLRKRGYDKKFVTDHINTVKGLKREEKEAIMRFKAAWQEASSSDTDSLSLDEFLAFLHPESSHVAILSHVENNLSVLDLDGDNALTAAEYLGGPEDPDEPHTRRQFDDADENKDGKLDIREMLLYRDPRHSHHARDEAERLFTEADADKDGRLTIDELLLRPRLFATSKMVNAAASFHGEF